MTLQKRELDTARELNQLLQGLSEKAYGNSDFKALLHTMDTQLMNNMRKLADEKGVVNGLTLLIQAYSITFNENQDYIISGKIDWFNEKLLNNN